MNSDNHSLIRVEPVFGLQTPLLFAHRGGVLEAPESTQEGFSHARQVADVLELDVQLTADGQIVVWHGPDLDNVSIEGESDRPSERPSDRYKVYHFPWERLARAWVGGPEFKKMKRSEIDLSDIPKTNERKLLLLTQFMELFPDMPLNIEIKKSFFRKIDEAGRKGLRHNIEALSKILDRDPGNRSKVIVSASDECIDVFREVTRDRYCTGLSVKEQLFLRFSDLNMRRRVLETSYSSFLSGKGIVHKVRDAGSSTFVFLTEFSFLLPAIDENPKEEEIFEVLDRRGGDGIMTDRPARLRQIVDAWKASR